ncbi:MAG TPA: hypothetical protein VKY74_25560 [Chloroflexia bacterium]|nr:hypothetical protein [Chloroflexia bacterium]
MKPWFKILLVTLLVAIPAVPLGQALWPAPAITPGSGGMPAYVPFLIFISIAEALSFGLGVAFLVFGLPLIRRVRVWSPALSAAVFVSIAWFLLSWWPHDGFHRSLGVSMWSLVAVEYTFHLTLMVAGGILALAFARLAQQAAGAARAPHAAAPASLAAPQR